MNIGCGTSIAPGWINVDNSPNARLSKFPRLKWALWKLNLLSDQHYNIKWPSSILVHDARKRLPFADCTVDYVYTSHYLEHNSVLAARKLVSEVFRVLREGGILRVVVPDLSLGARRYLEALSNDSTAARAADEFLKWMQLSRDGDRDPHLWMYDGSSLTALLVEQGFSNVSVCAPKQGRVPDCDILDHRPDDSLYVEAEKPRGVVK